MKKIPLVTMFLLGCAPLAGCGDSTQSVANIERVLKEDTTTNKGAKSVADVVARMRSIKLSGCPNDFQTAYVTHIHAWELLADVEKEAAAFDANFNSGGAFLEAFLRGVMLDPFGKANEAVAAHKELNANYQRAAAQIRDTFHRVEEIAVTYGASLTKKQSRSLPAPPERAFVEKLAQTIVKAARPSAKDVTLQEYRLNDPAEGRTLLIISAGYKGTVTGIKYTADIKAHIGSSTEGSWKVLSIDYGDNNKSLFPWNRRNVDALVR